MIQVKCHRATHRFIAAACAHFHSKPRAPYVADVRLTLNPRRGRWNTKQSIRPTTILALCRPGIAMAVRVGWAVEDSAMAAGRRWIGFEKAAEPADLLRIGAVFGEMSRIAKAPIASIRIGADPFGLGGAGESRQQACPRNERQSLSDSLTTANAYRFHGRTPATCNRPVQRPFRTSLLRPHEFGFDVRQFGPGPFEATCGFRSRRSSLAARMRWSDDEFARA